MSFAASERAQLCELMRAVGPDAPTLCEGWDAHDLAVHMWVRENDPIAAAGIVVPALAGLTERRSARVRQRFSYTQLVDRIAQGPPRISLFALPGLDQQINDIEMFVHHEDVRRAGDDPLPPRALSAGVEDALWRKITLLGRLLFRSAPVGVVLEREGADQAHRMSSGSQTVTLVAPPSELVLYAHGRRAVAQVRTIGEQAAVTALRQS